MTDFHQGYLYSYQHIDNVFYGTLSPCNAPAGYGPFTNVAYRVVEPRESELQALADSIEMTDIVEVVEIWNVTVTSVTVAPGSQTAKPQDVFDGQFGEVWNVKSVNSDALAANLNGVLVRPTSRLVCVRQV